MLKFLTFISCIGFISVLAAIGAFFAKTREVYVGKVECSIGSGGHAPVPLAKTKVQLYDAQELEAWSNGKLLKSFLNWKSPAKERELLDELIATYEGLLSIYQVDLEDSQSLANAHQSRLTKLAKYSTALDDTLLAVRARFPWETFIDLRNSIPESLFHPTLSLLIHKRQGLSEPKADSFYGYFADTFQDVSTFPGSDRLVLSRLRKLIDGASGPELLGYKPMYAEEQATVIIHQFYRVDKIAFTLQQYAANDDEIIATAPKPLLEATADMNGEVGFVIPRFFAKKFKGKTSFAVAAISDNQSIHPGQAYAWLKFVHLDQGAILPWERLPFFPPKQQFTFSSENALASLDDHLRPHDKYDPDAPLSPLKLTRLPAQEILYRGVSLLFAEPQHFLNHAGSHGHGGNMHDGHGHGHDSGKHHEQHQHGVDGNHGAPVRSEDADKDIGFEMFDEVAGLPAESPVLVRHDFELFDDNPPLKESGSTANGQAPSNEEEDSATNLDAVDSETKESRASVLRKDAVAPLEAETIHEKESSPAGSFSKVDFEALRKAIEGSWYNKEEQITFRFLPTGSFRMKIFDEEILGGFYRIPTDSAQPIISLTNKTNGMITHAIFEFLSGNSIRLELGHSNAPPPEKFSTDAPVFFRTQ